MAFPNNCTEIKMRYFLLICCLTLSACQTANQVVNDGEVYTFTSSKNPSEVQTCLYENSRLLDYKFLPERAASPDPNILRLIVHIETRDNTLMVSDISPTTLGSSTKMYIGDSVITKRRFFDEVRKGC